MFVEVRRVIAVSCGSQLSLPLVSSRDQTQLIRACTAGALTLWGILLAPLNGLDMAEL